MKTGTKRFSPTWYGILIALFFAGAAILYGYAGANGTAVIAVADNLDLFTAQYRMLKNTGTWFSQNVVSPFLGGVTRDDLPSERNLVALFYMLLPDYAAYIACKAAKVVLAIVSFRLLAGELMTYSEDERIRGREKAVITCTGFAYGILDLFPAYGISFSTIPLALYLFLRLGRTPWKDRKKTLFSLLLLFCYPFVSYFSYFGFFILCYALLALIVLWIRKKRFPLSLFAGMIALALGYVFFEYRLFASMLFSGEETIRTTMEMGDFSLSEVFQSILSICTDGMMHCNAVQKYLVLPVCAAYFVIHNIALVVTRRGRRIFHDLFNLAALLLVFNAVIYGLYYYAPFRNAVFSLVPPLSGFQFNRTVFFSPFLWYGSFAIILIRLVRSGRKGTGLLSGLLSILCVLVILLKSPDYNDLKSTARASLVHLRTGTYVNELSYDAFYSEKLFAKIKEDLGYEEGDFASYHPSEGDTEGSDAVLQGTGAQWAAAYGIHPAVLEYNGIATVDGYLGFYSEEYKEKFRKAIAPALEKQPATAAYFDDWGARCYLYSGTSQTIVEPVRNYPHEEDVIDIDTDALRDLGCTYLFSRIRITNAQEKDLSLVGVYTDESSPYTIYVYTF